MFISAKRHEREKQELLEASNRITEAILQNSDQGLFLLDAKDRIQPQVSRSPRDAVSPSGFLEPEPGEAGGAAGDREAALRGAHSHRAGARHGAARGLGGGTGPGAVLALERPAAGHTARSLAAPGEFAAPRKLIAARSTQGGQTAAGLQPAQGPRGEAAQRGRRLRFGALFVRIPSPRGRAAALVGACFGHHPRGAGRTRARGTSGSGGDAGRDPAQRAQRRRRAIRNLRTAHRYVHEDDQCDAQEAGARAGRVSQQTRGGARRGRSGEA